MGNILDLLKGGRCRRRTRGKSKRRSKAKRSTRKKARKSRRKMGKTLTQQKKTPLNFNMLYLNYIKIYKS